MTATQRKEICFPWDHIDATFGLSRSFVTNHWQVTAPCVSGAFFNRQQQALNGEIFRNLVDPAWHKRFLQQLSDDTKGHPFGQDQSIAIFGNPNDGPFQFLFTGRHVTLRADGGTTPDLAFGGPIVYGHAARGRYLEKPGHPENIFWPQSIAAGRIFSLLTPKQKAEAVVATLPSEHEIGFGVHDRGVSAAGFSPDQRAALIFLIHTLMAPFRSEERKRILHCLNSQGGVDVLKISYATENRRSNPEWDIWRLEGPYFVWHFQGHPHVHCWVHIAAEAQMDDVNAHKGVYLFSHHDPLQ